MDIEICLVAKEMLCNSKINFHDLYTKMCFKCSFSNFQHSKGPSYKKKECFSLCETGGVCQKKVGCKCAENVGWETPEKKVRGKLCIRPKRCYHCHKMAHCTKNNKCRCIHGFAGNGIKCEDKNECQDGS